MMSADFKLSYDPTEGIRGLQALRDSLIEAEKAGKKVPQSLLQMVDRVLEAANAADTAANAIDNFDNEIAQLSADMSKADDFLGSYAVSTMDAAQAAEIAAGKYDSLSGKIDKSSDALDRGASRADRAKDVFGGLEKILNNLGLGTLGQYFGAIEAVIMGFSELSKGAEIAKASTAALATSQAAQTVSATTAATATKAATIASTAHAAAEGLNAAATKTAGTVATKAAVQTTALGIAQAATTKIIVGANFETVELGIVSAITATQLQRLAISSTEAAAGITALRIASTGAKGNVVDVGTAAAKTNALLTGTKAAATGAGVALTAVETGAGAAAASTAAAGTAAAATTVTLAGLATGAALVGGAAYAAYINWEDYNEVVEQTADKNSLLDGTLLSVGQSIGLLTEEMVNESEATKKGIEFTDKFAKAMVEARNQADSMKEKIGEAITSMSTGLQKSRNALRESENLSQQNDAAELARQIDGIIASTNEQYKERNITLDEVQKRQERINQLEARRVEILSEQKQKEEELAKTRKEEYAERIKASEERLKLIEEERRAKFHAVKEVAQEEKKADEDSSKRITKLVEQRQEVAATPSAPSAPQSFPSKPVNPYGEGEAPTAGQQSDPYGGMLGLGGLPSFGFNGKGVAGGAVGSDLGFSGNVGMGLDLPSFGYQGKQSSGRASGFLDDRNTRKQAIDAAAAQKAEDEFRKTYRSEMEAQGTDNVQGFIERSGDLRESRRKDFNKFEKQARGDVGRDLKDGSTEDSGTQKAVDDAIRDTLQKQLDQLQKGGTFGKDVVDLSRDIVSKLQEEDSDIQQLAQDVQDLKKAIGMVGSKKNASEFATSNRNKAQRLGKGN